MTMYARENVLMVAFEFPPLGGVGVQRSLKFAKYLTEFGIRPVVVTIGENDYPQLMPGHPIDTSLLREIHKDIVIERVPCKPLPGNKSKLADWSRIYFSVVESFYELWREDLEQTIPGLISKYKPSSIYISLPPFAMAPLWREVLRKYDIPVVIDFRDAWSQWCVAPNSTYFHYLYKRKLEKDVLSWASTVVCSTPQIMRDLQQTHPEINHGKFQVIHNGFDSDLNLPESLKPVSGDKIKIGYVGSFYYTPESRARIFQSWWKKPPHRMLQYVPRKEDWLYRSPWFFFKAIRSFIDKHPQFKNRIEIHFAGKTPKWLLGQIAEFKLEENCFHNGFMSHEAVLEFQRNCDLLLITSSKVINGRDYSIAGKTYEYFTIGKPIVGFVCEGEQLDILKESGMAVICDPDDIEQSVSELEKLFSGNVELIPDKSSLSKYHRKHLAGKLAQVLKSHNSN